jgi:hypothetical protein
MSYLDTRCLTSSSLTPTSIIYYNNYNSSVFLFNYLSKNSKLYLNTIYILNKSRKQTRTS